MSDVLTADPDAIDPGQSEMLERIRRYRHLLPPISDELQARMSDAGAEGPPLPPLEGETPPPEVPDWPGLGPDAALDRAMGCLLGLAIGDAVGATVETLPRGGFPPVVGPLGGGPLGLAPGAWTDHTAMALCLADSLLAFGTVDLEDFSLRLAACQERGENTAAGRWLDIDPATRPALARFMATDPGDEAPPEATSGNGALVRIAPLAILAARDPASAEALAARLSRATHPDIVSIDCCRLFTAQLVDALTGADKDQALRPRVMSLCPSVLLVCGGEWREKGAEQIQADGNPVHTLEAALYAVANTGTFREAVRMAASFGGNASAVAAVAGQLAGALYGASGISTKWAASVAMRDRIILAASELATAEVQPS